MAADGDSGRTRKSGGRPLGPTGDSVRENIRRIRDGLGISQAELSKKLAQLGRPIPALGIHRIEIGERRVDVDDLMSFAVALGVTPVALLMPGDYPNGAHVDAFDQFSVTGFDEPVMALPLWNWLTAGDPLGADLNTFIRWSWPFWQRHDWNNRLEAERLKMTGELPKRITGGDDQ